MTQTTEIGHREDQTTAELMRRLSEQTSRLVRDEIHLAQAEMREKGKHAGFGIGLIGGAGALAFLGVGALVAGAVLALALVMWDWLAALIVGAGLLVIAAAMGLVGKQQTGHAVPAKPEATAESVRTDLQTVKEHRKQ